MAMREVATKATEKDHKCQEVELVEDVASLNEHISGQERFFYPTLHVQAVESELTHYTTHT